MEGNYYAEGVGADVVIMDIWVRTGSGPHLHRSR